MTAATAICVLLDLVLLHRLIAPLADEKNHCNYSNEKDLQKIDRFFVEGPIKDGVAASKISKLEKIGGC